MTIIAGCGIHNGGDMESRHDGIHRFLWERTRSLNMWKSITVMETERGTGHESPDGDHHG